jgi:hypothetical protein
LSRLPSSYLRRRFASRASHRGWCTEKQSSRTAPKESQSSFRELHC